MNTCKVNIEKVEQLCNLGNTFIFSQVVKPSTKYYKSHHKPLQLKYNKYEEYFRKKFEAPKTTMLL